MRYEINKSLLKKAQAICEMHSRANGDCILFCPIAIESACPIDILYTETRTTLKKLVERRVGRVIKEKKEGIFGNSVDKFAALL